VGLHKQAQGRKTTTDGAHCRLRPIIVSLLWRATHLEGYATTLRRHSLTHPTRNILLMFPKEFDGAVSVDKCSQL